MNLMRYYKTECKLLMRGPGMYFMLAGMAGILYLIMQTTDVKLDRAAYVLELFKVFGMVAIIIVPLLATAIARRDEEWKTSSLMASFPYRIVEMEAARLLSALTISVTVALVPMGVYAVLVLRDGVSWGAREWYTCAVWASFAIPMVCATALAYLVGILIRKRTGYLISFLLLLGLTLVLPEMFKSTNRLSFSLPLHKQMWLDYSLIRPLSTFYSRMWGFVDDPAFWLHRSMVAVLAAAAVMAVLLILFWRRREPVKAWLVYPALLIMGAAWLWAGSGMYRHLHERVAIAEANEQFYGERLTSANTKQQRELEQQLLDGIASGIYTEADKEKMAQIRLNSDGILSNPLSLSHINDLFEGAKFRQLQITRYKLELDLQPRHGLAIKASMHARNGHKEALQRFPITLRHIFDVHKLKVNGAAAAFEWEEAADVLWITPEKAILPEEPLEIEMTYSGIVNDWRRYYAYVPSRDQWHPIAVAADNRLVLPSFYGWYPVIGNDRLSELLTHYYQSERQATTIIDTHLPRPMADFEISVTGPSGLQLFSNAPTLSHGQTTKKGSSITQLKLEQASGISLFGGDLQLAKATEGGMTLRLLASGQYSARTVEEAAQYAVRQYAEAAQTLTRLDGQAATIFPETVTLALADYPYSILTESYSRTMGMVDAAAAGPQARDIHPISSSRYLGADIEQEKDGRIHLRTGNYWLDYSAKRREIRNAHTYYFNAQVILDNVFQSYIEGKTAGASLPETVLKPGGYFGDGRPKPIYALINTIYRQYGLESGFEMTKLIYNNIGTAQLSEDSDEQIENLLQDYLQKKREGKN